MSAAPINHLEDCFASAPLIRFKKGELFLRAGQMPGYVYYVRNGRIKVYTINDLGEKRVLLIVASPGLAPLMPLLGSAQTAPLSFFYEAMTDIELRKLSLERFANCLDTHKAAERVALDYTIGISRDLIHRLGILENKATRGKLLCLLRYLIKTCGSRQKNLALYNCNVTHQDVADLLGTSRETVSLQMKRLEEQGIIQQYRGGFTVDIEKI